MAYTTIEQTTFNIYVVGRALIKDKGKYLLLRRKSSEAYGDFWELPGGKLKTLEAIKEAVIREVFEETGLIIDFDANKVHVSSYIAQEGKHTGSTYLNLTFSDTKVTSGDIRIQDEHQKYAWFSGKEVFDLDLATYMRMPLTEILLPR